MKTAIEFETFVVEHYEPAVLTCDGGRSFSCCICAAQVVDSGDALERHVAWHKDRAPSVTINLTTALEEQFAATDVHETARRK